LASRSGNRHAGTQLIAGPFTLRTSPSDLVKSDRVYWYDYELNQGYSLFALNDAGHLASLTLPASLSAHTLTEKFVYMEARSADGFSIRRLALSEIE
jgi:hypothetical protein